MARGGPETLTDVPLFAGLSKRHLRNIADLMEETRVERGSALAEEGTSGDDFHVIIEGEAKVLRGNRTINRLLPGDFFGEIALIDGGPRTASVVAETPVTTLRLQRAPFRKLLEQEPTVVVKMLEELARRLRSNERSLNA